jgi:archaellum component FlaC
MSNIKNIAEDLLQLTNKSHKLDEVIHLLKSTENTLAEDILALIEGAKLECKVDIKKINTYLEEIDNLRYSAEDEISSCQRNIEDACSSIQYMEDEINGLRNYLSDLKWEKKEEDKE